MIRVETSAEAIRYVRAETDTVLLGFSGGKDSVATWLVLREHFNRVVPIFHYWVPDLEFVEAGLRYYEEFFETPVVRLPHPAWFQLVGAGAFQDPIRYRVVERWDLGKPDFRRMANWVAEDLGLSTRWMAVGLRAADSVIRRRMFAVRGYADERQQKFYPIAQFLKADMVALLQKSGVRLSPEYAFMGRSFDGLNTLYLQTVKDKFPRDFERIKQWFPLIEAEFFRREIYHAGQKEKG